jgi:ankyrin repeat protein
MFHAEWIEYLKRENKSKNFDQIKNYYMPRKLRRFIRIDRKILEKKHDDFIIVHTDADFNEKCRQNHDHKKSIHYLILNQNYLLWQKSNGPTSTLNEFIIKNEECEESIDETEIFQKNNEKVLLISAEPGMGKSLISDNFTQNSSVENFFVKIILNTCKQALSSVTFEEYFKMDNDLLEFVLKFLLNKKDEQEIKILRNLAQQEKLILMFDGLDEVNDYKEQVIHLIDALNKEYRIKKILITTRNHLRQELEDHFSTFAFNLNNFDDEDQKSFLYKYWRSSNLKHKERATSAKLKQSAHDLITQMKSILLEEEKNLNQMIAIPLQTKMLADIYFEQIKHNNKDETIAAPLQIANIAELYHEFVESKIRIQLEVKSEIGKMHKRFHKYIEMEKSNFYSDHIKLAYKHLFVNSDEMSFEEFEEDNEGKLQEILEYGVIVAFTPDNNKVPTFLHQSFAEFFLAKSSLQKIAQNKEIDKELEQIFRDKRHFLIRKFLNDLMSKRELWRPNGEQQKDMNNGKEIENCCRENLISLLKHFLEQNEAILKKPNEFLIIASHYGNKAIVEYLIEKGIYVNQQFQKRVNKDEEEEELLRRTTALIEASQCGHTEIVQLLLQHKNINVNLEDERGQTALYVASQYGHNEIVQLLLNRTDINVNIQAYVDGGGKYWRGTALYVASEEGHIEIVTMLLNHKDIHNVNLQNGSGQTALYVASYRGHKECVELLLNQKDINVNLQNEYGQTALFGASSQGYTEIVQLLLKHKDINVNLQNKEGCTVLIWESQSECVELLLGHKDIDVNQKNKYGQTALMWAFKEGHLEIVELLLKHKNTNVDKQYNWGQSALMGASKKGHKEFVQLLLLINSKNISVNRQENENEISALMLALNPNYKELVRLLLEQKDINVNQKDDKGRTALLEASEQGHTEIVQLLLEQKDINVNQEDEFGDTALLEASEQGHTEIVQLLLEHKDIDVNQSDKHQHSALFMAAYRGHKEIIKLLLKHKDINVNLQNIEGYTVLIWASEDGHKEIVEELLKKPNINVNLQNDYTGDTALMSASREGHKEIVKMLEEKMQKEKD